MASHELETVSSHDSSLRKQVGHDMSKRDHNPGEEGSCAVQTLRVRGYLESKLEMKAVPYRHLTHLVPRCCGHRTS